MLNHKIYYLNYSACQLNKKCTLSNSQKRGRMKENPNYSIPFCSIPNFHKQIIIILNAFQSVKNFRKHKNFFKKKKQNNPGHLRHQRAMLCRNILLKNYSVTRVHIEVSFFNKIFKSEFKKAKEFPKQRKNFPRDTKFH